MLLLIIMTNFRLKILFIILNCGFYHQVDMLKSTHIQENTLSLGEKIKNIYSESRKKYLEADIYKRILIPVLPISIFTSMCFFYTYSFAYDAETPSPKNTPKQNDSPQINEIENNYIKYVFFGLILITLLLAAYQLDIFSMSKVIPLTNLEETSSSSSIENFNEASGNAPFSDEKIPSDNEENMIKHSILFLLFNFGILGFVYMIYALIVTYLEIKKIKENHPYFVILNILEKLQILLIIDKEENFTSYNEKKHEILENIKQILENIKLLRDDNKNEKRYKDIIHEIIKNLHEIIKNLDNEPSIKGHEEARLTNMIANTIAINNTNSYLLYPILYLGEFEKLKNVYVFFIKLFTNLKTKVSLPFLQRFNYQKSDIEILEEILNNNLSNENITNILTHVNEQINKRTIHRQDIEGIEEHSNQLMNNAKKIFGIVEENNQMMEEAGEVEKSIMHYQQNTECSVCQALNKEISNVNEYLKRMNSLNTTVYTESYNQSIALLQQKDDSVPQAVKDLHTDIQKMIDKNERDILNEIEAINNLITGELQLITEKINTLMNKWKNNLIFKLFYQNDMNILIPLINNPNNIQQNGFDDIKTQEIKNLAEKYYTLLLEENNKKINGLTQRIKHLTTWINNQKEKTTYDEYQEQIEELKTYVLSNPLNQQFLKNDQAVDYYYERSCQLLNSVFDYNKMIDIEKLKELKNSIGERSEVKQFSELLTAYTQYFDKIKEIHDNYVLQNVFYLSSIKETLKTHFVNGGINSGDYEANMQYIQKYNDELNVFYTTQLEIKSIFYVFDGIHHPADIKKITFSNTNDYTVPIYCKSDLICNIVRDVFEFFKNKTSDLANTTQLINMLFEYIKNTNEIPKNMVNTCTTLNINHEILKNKIDVSIYNKEFYQKYEFDNDIFTKAIENNAQILQILNDKFKEQLHQTHLMLHQQKEEIETKIENCDENIINKVLSLKIYVSQNIEENLDNITNNVKKIKLTLDHLSSSLKNIVNNIQTLEDNKHFGDVQGILEKINELQCIHEEMKSMYNFAVAKNEKNKENNEMKEMKIVKNQKITEYKKNFIQSLNENERFIKEKVVLYIQQAYQYRTELIASEEKIDMSKQMKEWSEQQEINKIDRYKYVDGVNLTQYTQVMYNVLNNTEITEIDENVNQEIRNEFVICQNKFNEALTQAQHKKLELYENECRNLLQEIKNMIDTFKSKFNEINLDELQSMINMIIELKNKIPPLQDNHVKIYTQFYKNEILETEVSETLYRNMKDYIKVIDKAIIGANIEADQVATLEENIKRVFKDAVLYQQIEDIFINKFLQLTENVETLSNYDYKEKPCKDYYFLQNVHKYFFHGFHCLSIQYFHIIKDRINEKYTNIKSQKIVNNFNEAWKIKYNKPEEVVIE